MCVDSQSVMKCLCSVIAFYMILKFNKAKFGAWICTVGSSNAASTASTAPGSF